MSDLRTAQPGPTSNFFSSRSDAAPKLADLLKSLDPKTRAAIEALAKADPVTRAEVLSSLEPEARSVMELILKDLN